MPPPPRSPNASSVQHSRNQGVFKNAAAGFVGRPPSQILSFILSEAKNPEQKLQTYNGIDSSLRC
jgi:hypothetical protein